MHVPIRFQRKCTWFIAEKKSGNFGFFVEKIEILGGFYLQKKTVFCINFFWNVPVRCANTCYETIILFWEQNVYKSLQKNFEIFVKKNSWFISKNKIYLNFWMFPDLAQSWGKSDGAEISVKPPKLQWICFLKSWFFFGKYFKNFLERLRDILEPKQDYSLIISIFTSHRHIQKKFMQKNSFFLQVKPP